MARRLPSAAPRGLGRVIVDAPILTPTTTWIFKTTQTFYPLLRDPHSTALARTSPARLTEGGAPLLLYVGEQPHAISLFERVSR